MTGKAPAGHRDGGCAVAGAVLPGGERRRSSRVAYFTEAWLEGLDVADSAVRLGDLSAEGAFVDARMVLPPGTIARLRFRLDDREIGVMTEVRYAIPSIGMGLHFLDLAAEDRRTILSFVSATRPRL